MSSVGRHLPIAGLALAVLTNFGFGQSTLTHLQSLQSIVQDLDAHPEGHGPQWAGELDGPINAASITEIKQEIPSLVRLTESPNSQQRGNALLVLYAIAARQKTGLPENRGQLDLLGGEAIVPYIFRIAPRFTDSTAANRSFALLLFQNLAAVRPVSPELVNVALTVLQDPQSTQAPPDTARKSLSGDAPSIGPQMLWVLLPADATFHLDPATSIAEGQDSPEVQQAIITFLRRPDQTAESLSETARALAVAQVQNPAVNAELLRLLDSTDPAVQGAILRHIAALTLTAEDFASARFHVTQIAANTNTPIEIQKLAKTLLACWSNDRHHGICPPLGS